MELVTIIIQEWICPLAIVAIFGFLIFHFALGFRKAVQSEADNTVKIIIHKDEVPEAMGSLFGNTFAQFFSELFGGDKR